ISAQVVGTQVSITMGTLRSMQVFVLGEAFKPGAYTVSSLATITHALIASGGINDIGSLRNIQLKRKGVVIASLDIYDLLLFGDTSDDIQIRDFDVIYIPTVGDRVSIMGGVLRPAIYEMIGGETASDLVDLAGGLVAKAYAKSARLERVNEDGFLRVLDLDLTKPSDKQLHLSSGDHLAIDSVTDFKKNIVTLAGAVRYPGIVAWRADLRISDLLKARDVLNSQADTSVALLIRELPNSPDIKIFQFSPEQIFADLYSSDNRFLQSRDRIEILSLYGDRIEQIEPYIKMLKRQASFENETRVVTVGGEVRFPGSYPLVENMVMADLVKLSGGLTSSAYGISTEIGRIDLSDPTNAQRSIVISRFDQESSFKLQPSDSIEIRTLPDFRERQSITLQGEFVFPGTYDFEKGETLTSVIARAGGFTSEAFVGGSVFTRESLKKREEVELSRLSDLLQGQVESERLKQANSGVETTNLDIETQEMAISRLSNVQAVGRLVIPMADLMAGVATDLILQNSDQLVIPKMSQEVTVIGEVYRPSSHLFNEVLSQDDYIRKSGGLKHSADEDNIFIVKANGEVIGSENRLFKFRSVDADIQFGDSIVVPLDTEASDVSGVEFLTQISQIIYQLSLGAAAVNTFNKN
ncbi:MAG: SLBB domain-containing protein, partial [Porticoccaceae bacterium]|nr:SLBB domain-containing protein [Porticoccaceae bacterium]